MTRYEYIESMGILSFIDYLIDNEVGCNFCCEKCDAYDTKDCVKNIYKYLSEEIEEVEEPFAVFVINSNNNDIKLAADEHEYKHMKFDFNNKGYDFTCYEKTRRLNKKED